MNQITSPLQPGMQGSTVADLQDALLLLMGRQIIKTFQPPNRPTAEELKTLAQALKQERAQSTFGNTTQRLVTFFQNQQGLGDNLRGIVEAKTAAKLNTILHDLGVLTSGDDPRKVFGMVRDEFGTPLANGTVQAFDCDIRSEKLLGSTGTKLGQYEIIYQRSQFLRAEKVSADLVLKVLDAAGKELHQTPIRYNVANEVEINIVLQGGTYQGPSEFDVLIEKLSPLLGELSPQNLREDDQFQDISFLSGESGHSRLNIGTWVASNRLADKTRQEQAALEPAVFYAFMRQGQPSLLYDSLLEDVKQPERITLLEDKILKRPGQDQS